MVPDAASMGAASSITIAGLASTATASRSTSGTSNSSACGSRAITAGWAGTVSISNGAGSGVASTRTGATPAGAGSAETSERFRERRLPQWKKPARVLPLPLFRLAPQVSLGQAAGLQARFPPLSNSGWLARRSDRHSRGRCARDESVRAAKKVRWCGDRCPRRGRDRAAVRALACGAALSAVRFPANVDDGDAIIVGVGDIERLAIGGDRQRVGGAPLRGLGEKSREDRFGDDAAAGVDDGHGIA